ncbi:hypothetical protein Pelo_6934 [Pelomyxa schiedti]|nr:hypothetical protein Pelo_6934 [Pelomyxa schiedti]
MGAESSALTKVEAAQIRNQYGLPQEKFDVVLKSFQKHADRNGKISSAAFKQILDGVMHPDLADKVFASFDRDNSGTMDVREYLAMMGVTHGGTLEQKLNASFELFDKNGDGVLSKEEIREMFVMIVKQKRTATNMRKSAGSAAASAVELDDKAMAAINSVINTVFDRIDVDRNGTIDRDEFLNGFAKHPDVCGFFKQF